MESTAASSFADPSVHVPERSDSQRINLFRSIAERRAANCGSDAARISKARSRKTRPLACPVRSRVSCSPCLTIPPSPAGISPTVSLDSPVVLLNPRVRLFPTTGTFSCPQLLDESLMKSSDYEKGSSQEDDQEIAASDQDFVLENGSVRIKAGDSYEKDSPVILSCSNEFHGAMELKPVPTGSIFTDGTDAGGPERGFAPEDDGESRKRPYISLVMAKSSENGINGYNWRKYGQKLVKGSECPRSYYRCTHPNCPVKKKVEQSDDGEMKVIIYKGAHNHQKPQPPRRRAAARGSSLTVPGNVPEIGDGSGIGAEVDIEVEPLRGDTRSGPEGEKLDDLEGTSLTSVMTEISEAVSSIPRRKGLEVFESVQAPELSSALASHGIDEDDIGEEADDNELDYKRRKCENCLLSWAVPEPRVAIQIESQTDIIDDGYRWRKYGQKVIKGNPNPRSYYKCTSPGCPVRKHVQRASDDLRYVIMTYEGKHNHYKPTLRKDCVANDGNPSGGGTSPPPPIHSQSSNPNLNSKPKPEVQDLIRSDQKPEFGFGHEFLRSRSLLSTTSGNGMKFGASSMYPGNFLPIWSCGSSGTGLWFEPDPSGQSYGFCRSRLTQFNPFQAQPASKRSPDWA